MGDLQIGETFKDRCFLTVFATGAPANGLADVTCTIIDELGNRSVGTVVELSDGWYHCTDFTPDAAGNWATEWSKTADPGDYVFHYPYKEFKVGGGEVTDIKAETALIKAQTDLIPADPADQSDVETAITNAHTTTDGKIDVIDAFHDVPVKDAVTNLQMRDVLGQKTDTPKWFFTDTQSAMALLKGAVHSGGGISYAGTCDAGMAASTTVIVCAQLAGFGDDFFNTDYVLKVALNDNSHGASPEADAARDITDYVSATGTFTCAAFNNNVEANDKIVVSKRSFYLIDQIAVQTTPGTNSLAYHLSRYLADGDGDFATGSALPSNKSLYDVIVLDRLDNATYGLSALETLVDDLETRLTAARAGYMDKIANYLQTVTFFSPTQISVTLTNGAGDKALPTVTIPNWSGTPVHVYAGFICRMIENTNAAANKLAGAQEIQVNKAGGAWTDAIHMVDDLFGVAATTREGGTVVMGYTDLVGTINVFNTTAQFQWDEGVADQSNLVFNDVQTFVIIQYY